MRNTMPSLVIAIILAGVLTTAGNAMGLTQYLNVDGVGKAPGSNAAPMTYEGGTLHSFREVDGDEWVSSPLWPTENYTVTNTPIGLVATAANTNWLLNGCGAVHGCIDDYPPNPPDEDTTYIYTNGVRYHTATVQYADPTGNLPSEEELITDVVMWGRGKTVTSGTTNLQFTLGVDPGTGYQYCTPLIVPALTTSYKTFTQSIPNSALKAMCNIDPPWTWAYLDTFISLVTANILPGMVNVRVTALWVSFNYTYSHWWGGHTYSLTNYYPSMDTFTIRTVCAIETDAEVLIYSFIVHNVSGDWIGAGGVGYPCTGAWWEVTLPWWIDPAPGDWLALLVRGSQNWTLHMDYLTVKATCAGAGYTLNTSGAWWPVFVMLAAAITVIPIALWIWLRRRERA